MQERKRGRASGAVWSLWIVGMSIVVIGAIMLGLGASWWLSLGVVLVGLVALAIALYMYGKSQPGGRPHPPQ